MGKVFVNELVHAVGPVTDDRVESAGIGQRTVGLADGVVDVRLSVVVCHGGVLGILESVHLLRVFGIFLVHAGGARHDGHGSGSG